jgi:hypothetical protein
MVEGVAELRRRFRTIVPEIRKELRPILERQAKSIVGQMMATRPIPEIQVEWKWGPPPPGVIAIAKVSEDRADRDFISIYATGSSSDRPEFPGLARWFEFGTAERFHKKGKTPGKSVGRITAQPYFYPVYRANTDKVRQAIARKLRQTVKNL